MGKPFRLVSRRPGNQRGDRIYESTDSGKTEDPLPASFLAAKLNAVERFVCLLNRYVAEPHVQVDTGNSVSGLTVRPPPLD